MGEKDKADPEEEQRAKRIDVSFAQVAGSAVAAVIAAVLAGKLGVYGTFLGAGVVSVVATTGGPVFQHFFRRTGEQLKDKTVHVQPGTTRVTLRERTEEGPDEAATTVLTVEEHRTGDPAGPADLPGQVTGPPGTAVPRRGSGGGSGAGNGAYGAQDHGRGADRTQLLRTDMVRRATGPAPGRNGEPGGNTGAGTGQDAGEDVRTRPLRQLAADRTQLLRTGEATRALPRNGLPGEPGEDEEFSAATVHGTRRRLRWRMLLPALLVFVVAIGGITLYEAVSGNNVSGGKGTSIGHVFHHGGSSGGGTGTDDAPATPSPGPSTGDDGSTAPGGDDGSTGVSPSPGTGTDGTDGTDDSGSTPAPDRSGSSGDSDASDSGGDGSDGTDSSTDTSPAPGTGDATPDDGTPQSEGGQDTGVTGQSDTGAQQSTPGTD